MNNITKEMVKYVEEFLFKKCMGTNFTLDIIPLFGDGSDRKIYRVLFNDESVVLVTNSTAVKLEKVCENDSFYNICNHLKEKGVPVPEIYSYSKEKGFFILEDLGDETLFKRVTSLNDMDEIKELYKRSLDILLNMQIEGIKGFDPEKMCYASKYYDKDLILEYESGYFFKEFLNCYLKLDLYYDDFFAEFSYLADEALKNGGHYFLHRDYQARNIMIKDDKLRIIDFQGGRVGTLKYDLAALVIDAFVNLPFDVKDELFDYYIDNLKKLMEVDEEDFKKRLYYTAAHRAMQALGAYAFLTLKKGKTHFEEHMGKGVNNLKVFLSRTTAMEKCPKFIGVINKVHEKFHGGK